jgi:hypothetical protein
MAADETDTDIDDAGELELEGAREYVIKQRCEDIIEARRQALDALAKYHALRQEASTQSDIKELNTHVAGQVWQFAFESKTLLSQTGAGETVWEQEDLGRWRLGEPQVSEEIRRIDRYRVQGRAPTDQTPTLRLVGVREFVDLSPPVTVEATAEVVPSGTHSPMPETRTVTYREAPPRDILVAVFEAVDGVVSDLGLAPEVNDATDDGEFDYEDLI